MMWLHCHWHCCSLPVRVPVALGVPREVAAPVALRHRDGSATVPHWQALHKLLNQT